MNIAIISRSSETYFNRRIIEEARNTGVNAFNISHSEIIIMEGKPFRNGQETSPDIAFLRTPPYKEEKDYISLIGEVLEINGTTTINKPAAAEICGNKVLTKLKLEAKGIKTLKWALVKSTANLDQAASSVGGYPLFLKTIYGTRGIGVIFCPCRETLHAGAQTLWAYNANIFTEEYAGESKGATVRVLVANNNVIGAVRNIADTENHEGLMTLRRSNFSRGGCIMPYEPDSAMKTTAVKSCEVVGAKLAGIDFIETASGWAVLEINSSPGIKGFEKAAGINAAKAILESFIV